MSAPTKAGKPIEEPTCAQFHFDEKAKVQPVGYEGLGIDQQATVIIKGKIRRLGSSRWENGKGFDIEIESCEISSPPAVRSIEDAVQAAQAAAKKVK